MSLPTIYTCVNAKETKIGTWGYFSNDLAHMKQALDKHKINAYTYYDKLDKVLEEHEPRRFSAPDSGQVFALYCPIDENFNSDRY